MAFWGVELKPGKPYVHRYEDDQGRLRLSQATLGSGTATKKTIVQCKVGDNMAINLCSLLPEKLENCALNLEFEEDEDVTFSVVGPHSVHLSGFFLDPFDGDPEKQLVVRGGTSGGDPVLESEDEDEDGFPLSSPRSGSSTAANKKAKEDFGHEKSLKRKIDDDPLREIGSASDEGADNTTDTAPVKDSKQKKKNVNKDDIGHESNGKGSTSTPQEQNSEQNSADTEQMPATTKKKGKKKKNEKVDAQKLETSGSNEAPDLGFHFLCQFLCRPIKT